MPDGNSIERGWVTMARTIATTTAVELTGRVRRGAVGDVTDLTRETAARG